MCSPKQFSNFFPFFFGEVFLCFWFKIIFEGGLIAVGGRVDLVSPQIPTTKDDFPFFCVLLICIKIPSNCRMCVVFKQMRSSSSNHFENLAVLLLACKVLGIYLCSNSTYILVRFLQNSSLHCIPRLEATKANAELLLKLSHSAGLSVCLIMRFIC